MAKIKWDYSGDVDVLGYGGVFLRHVGGRRYHAVRFDNMEEHLSAWEMENVDKYSGSLVEVDLDTADLDGARRCCDCAEDASDLELAFACIYYGSFAPLSDENGNNGNRIIRNLKRESREIEGDSDRYEHLMERPVNAIGSTAREFARGDIQSALKRGLEAGEAAAGVVATMEAASRPKVGTCISINMKRTGSDDPIAFAYGFSQGAHGAALEKNRKKLAPEYLRGHAEGLKVFEGGDLPDYVRR